MKKNFFCIFIILFIGDIAFSTELTNVIKTEKKDGITYEVETLNEILSVSKIIIITNVENETDRTIDNYYNTMVKNVNEYLDWFYCLTGSEVKASSIDRITGIPLSEIFSTSLKKKVVE